MPPSDMKQLRQLEEENVKLKKLVADLSLDQFMLQDILTKKSKACRETGYRALSIRTLIASARISRTVLRVNRGFSAAVNECCCMDFISDQLYNGKRFWALTALDIFCWEVSPSTWTNRYGRTNPQRAEKKQDSQRLPRRIKIDNGSEFISPALYARAYFNKVTLDYSRPGTATDNPLGESFSGSLRDEC